MDATPAAQTFTNVAVAGGSATISGLSAGTYNDLSITHLGCTSTEDVDILLTETCLYDWGDLPDTSATTNALDYQTSAANNGPNHLIIDGLHLGPDVDNELNGQANTTATGDGDDENGLTLFSSVNVIPGGTLQLPFSATNTTGNTAYVEMWIDWNGDGAFTPDEFVIDIDDSMNPLPTQLDINVPTNVIDQQPIGCLLYTSPSPRDLSTSRMPSSA